ncbi:DoxX family membrane protein [Streptomyces sp. PTM05]|uniref:DoxX family membrane protein n=1 Tax=Streptantibioticus parmotrematis TaxID=2873249 RepID=A0ABS7QP64_9ACTN|nr:DoxX family protein [Streptantibioticus parmotrematis]MBY8884977.1 DoxX family membrane protein [Streptantibioticus parmotrematis]
MSVDTRTPRSPSGGRSPGFDEDVLNTVRVPSDPAQVIVNHASFRVRLGASAPPPRFGAVAGDTAPMPVIPTSVRSAAEARTRRRRAAPVVWSGRAEAGDAEATQLLQAAVRGVGAGATQVLPRVAAEELLAEELDETLPPVRPAVIAPRSPLQGGSLPGVNLLGGVRPVRGAFDHDADDDAYDISHASRYDDGDDRDADDYDERDARDRARERRRNDPVRHAWYPGRRMNLGVVLLPMRVFLGFICVYAGLGKLCDPVYFDGGQRGSMVHWLSSLHPWSVAEPLRAAALGHPVGAGLTVAFLQVVVGVLTVMGLWQRVAACVGAMLSVALLVTVSWRSVPVYDAPNIIYLAAWSPLVIAGAPVYSVDAKLAGEAWRKLGPRAPIWDLRRYVLRRGVVLATFVAGGTLILGALFGGAVRASQSHPAAPAAPTDLPTNSLPGSPLPQTPGSSVPTRHRTVLPGASRNAKSASPKVTSSARPGAEGATTGPGRTSGAGTGDGLPSQEQTVQAPTRHVTPPQRTAPVAPNPAPSSGGSSGGSGGGGSLGGLLGIKPSNGWLLGMPGDQGARPPSGGSMA